MATTQARLIIDPPATGSWNMAVDQALLETAEKTGQTTLRIYFWEPATVSLGYFQKHEDRKLHKASLKCPLVRRKTGGGAIIHDREITYSLCVPSQQRWSGKNRELYDRVHQSLIQLLATYQIKAKLFGEDPDGQFSKESFLCFQRRASGDLIVDGYKVGGSAQRRLKRSLLQHGSILMERSKFAPELPGISELAKRNFNQQEFLDKWLELLSDCLRIDLCSDSLASDETQLAQTVHQTVFASQEWNQNR